MGSSIQNLKDDHRRILDILKSCRDSGKSPEDTMELSKTLHTLLLEHLDREDAVVYPMLREAATDDMRMSAMLDRFDDELLEIALVAKEFFYVSAQGGKKRIEHIRDYGTFFILLKDRQEREETVIFPEFERLSRQSGQFR